LADKSIDRPCVCPWRTDFARLNPTGDASGSPEQPYTIKQGHNLSHISQRFYGAASKYTRSRRLMA